MAAGCSFEKKGWGSRWKCRPDSVDRAFCTRRNDDGQRRTLGPGCEFNRDALTARQCLDAGLAHSDRGIAVPGARAVDGALSGSVDPTLQLDPVGLVEP